MPSPDDAAWLAQSIGAYLLGQAASLDAAAGLAPTRGRERPWRTIARAERDALIRHVRTVLYPEAGPCAAAALIARDLRRFAATGGAKTLLVENRFQPCITSLNSAPAGGASQNRNAASLAEFPAAAGGATVADIISYRPAPAGELLEDTKKSEPRADGMKSAGDGPQSVIRVLDAAPTRSCQIGDSSIRRSLFTAILAHSGTAPSASTCRRAITGGGGTQKDANFTPL
jgi:hypothetical protein